MEHRIPTHPAGLLLVGCMGRCTAENAAGNGVAAPTATNSIPIETPDAPLSDALLTALHLPEEVPSVGNDTTFRGCLQERKSRGTRSITGR